MLLLEVVAVAMGLGFVGGSDGLEMEMAAAVAGSFYGGDGRSAPSPDLTGVGSPAATAAGLGGSGGESIVEQLPSGVA